MFSTVRGVTRENPWRHAAQTSWSLCRETPEINFCSKLLNKEALEQKWAKEKQVMCQHHKPNSLSNTNLLGRCHVYHLYQRTKGGTRATDSARGWYCMFVWDGRMTKCVLIQNPMIQKISLMRLIPSRWAKIAICISDALIPARI